LLPFLSLESLIFVPRLPRNFREVWEFLEISGNDVWFGVPFCSVLKGVLIMTLLPVTTCAQMLGIHPKTLHHWLKEAKVPLVTHPTDARVKCLTEHHLQEVARLHDRSLPQRSDGAAESQEQAASLPDQLACSSSPIRAVEPDLMQQLTCLETRVATLQQQLTELALALVAERERTLERRIVTLETSTSQQMGNPPSFPQRQMALPTLSPATVPLVPRTLHPAELGPHARLIALIEYGASGTYVAICPQEGELALAPDSPEWFAWLASLSSFRFVGKSGRFTASRGSKHHRPTRSWRAVRSLGNHNYKSYPGVTEHLTVARLEQAAATLQAHMTSL
jgi:hypothetical protein